MTDTDNLCKTCGKPVKSGAIRCIQCGNFIDLNKEDSPKKESDNKPADKSKTQFERNKKYIKIITVIGFSTFVLFFIYTSVHNVYSPCHYVNGLCYVSVAYTIGDLIRDISLIIFIIGGLVYLVHYRNR